MRAFLYYSSACVLLYYYGKEVCPFLNNEEEIGRINLELTLGVFYSLAYLVHLFIVKKLISSVAVINQPKKLLISEIAIFLGLGISISIYNMIAHSFPLGSGLKVLLGTSTIGFFASLDLVLERERKIIHQLIDSPAKGHITHGFFSLPKKFTMIAIVTSVFSSAILLLLVIKDFNWLANNIKEHGVGVAQQSVIIEILFVVAILFSLGVILIISYSKNLRLYFQSETRVLERVAEGNLESYVPIVTNDEFGLIAQHTNEMIDGLKEKNRIKNIFGKMVSPQIAKKLYEQGDGDIKMGGSRQDMVILFSDIRNFTSLTEKSDPEQLIDSLNLYFTLMVNIINRNNGLVDKFIGDGILAVFGFEGIHNAVNHSVRAAVEMQKALSTLDSEILTGLEIGIGIHRGEVIAGIIGSPDHLEFTFVGDTVNTASRLESITKTLDATIIISSEIHRELDSDLLSLPWDDMGTQALKGKEKEIAVMGIRKTPSKQ